MQRDLVDGRELSRQELQDLRNKRTGVTIFQISWILVFVCLIMVNLQLRANFASWPPPGVEAYDRLLPTLALAGLLVSAFVTRAGLQAMTNGNRAGFQQLWRIAIALGAAFVVIMAYEWVTVPFSGQYSIMFRVMTAFHGVHALVIGAIMINVYRHAAGYDALRHWAVEAVTKLWYFVVIAWILFYMVLYII